MTISMTTMTTGSNLHGPMKPGNVDFARSVQSFFGVIGEYHLMGKLRGRELTAWFQLTGYTSHANIHTAMETIASWIGESGNTTWVVGSDTKTFGSTIFEGFAPEEEPWLDGSGNFGWNCKGVLKWRQIAT